MLSLLKTVDANPNCKVQFGVSPFLTCRAVREHVLGFRNGVAGCAFKCKYAGSPLFSIKETLAPSLPSFSVF